jgi:hypothetical protein
MLGPDTSPPLGVAAFEPVAPVVGVTEGRAGLPGWLTAPSLFGLPRWAVLGGAVAVGVLVGGRR